MLPPMNVPIIHDEYHPTIPSPAIINDDTNKSIANIFCFGAFADCHSGVVYLLVGQGQYRGPISSTFKILITPPK
jgi:hypothetical protein